MCIRVHSWLNEIMFDVLIRGGTVVDGRDAPARIADLGVAGEKITALGDLATAEAKDILDARGKVVCPGFIDAHVHGDLVLLSEDAPMVAEAAIRQGITTFIIGQDGCSYAPASPPTINYFREYCAGFNGNPDMDYSWRSVDEFLARFDRRNSLNVAYLIPNGTVRMEVVGLENRRATADELRTMRRMVEDGMEQGAIGLSSGLDYIPSLYADVEEMTELCREIAPHGGVYVTHMRAYRDKALEAMDEVFAVGRNAHCRVHISHFNSKADMVIPKLDAARQSGIHLTYDSYPYQAGSTLLAMICLPEWVQAGGVDATLERLADKSVRAKLAAWFAEPPTAFENVQLSSVPIQRDSRTMQDSQYSNLEGLPLLEAAKQVGCSVGDLICDLLLACRLNVGCIVFQKYRTEDDLRRLMQRPEHMAGSDGIYVGGRPHPRGWGAFARFVGHYVREKVWTLEEAVQHLSANAAQVYNLRDRGIVREGFIADLVVFDPQKIRDVATYENGRQLAEGVEHVLVNGQFALRDGKFLGAPVGRALRRK